MRTTLTLEADVAATLERIRAKRRQSLKQVVNDALRQGLMALETPPDVRGEYRTPSTSLGGCRFRSLDDVAEALAVGEGEGFR